MGSDNLIRVLGFLLLSAALAAAADNVQMESAYSPQDLALDANPTSQFWQHARPVFAETDAYGHPVPGHRTEIRSRWTRDNLYFLFICPYEELYLKPSPDIVHETNRLWNWDVAEVFIGSNFRNIRRYREFEISPQGEWMDLDIDLARPHHEDGWVWNSGFEAAARIDRAARVWYGAMRIPLSAIDDRPPVPGSLYRMNLFRSQGPPKRQRSIAWQPPMRDTFHTPERFGLLRLAPQGRDSE